VSLEEFFLLSEDHFLVEMISQCCVSLDQPELQLSPAVDFQADDMLSPSHSISTLTGCFFL
jgi:hypothetical protein